MKNGGSFHSYVKLPQHSAKAGAPEVRSHYFFDSILAFRAALRMAESEWIGFVGKILAGKPHI